MKRFINSALFLEQLKRFWPIAAIAMFGYLLLIVQPLYFPTFYNPEHAPRGILVIMSMRNPVLVISMVAIPFVTALALFSYPYRVASSTAYHSLPINRMQLFFTHGAAGLTLMLVPLLLLTLFLLVPISHTESLRFIEESNVVTVFGNNYIYVSETINSLPRMLGFFLRSAVGFTMYFAVFILATSIAGNRVIAVLLSAVFAFAPMAFVGLSGVIGSFYIFGFGLAPVSPVETVAIFTHPTFWGEVYGGISGFFGSFAYERSLVPFFISYGLIALGAFGLAFLAYRLRPQERAGDTVAFLPVKRVLIFIFALAGMVTLGVLWFNVSGLRVGLYVGFVVGFLIAYFIAQMIAEKTFRIGNKVTYVVTYGAVALGLYGLLLLVTTLGFWGYVRRVPDMQEITGVFVEQTFGRDAGSGLGREGHFFIDDPAIIAQVRELHEGIVDERRYLQQARWSDVGMRSWIIGWNGGQISITYRLADGSTIHRSYQLSHDFSRRWNVNRLMTTGHVIRSHAPLLSRPEAIEFINFDVNLEHAWAFALEIDRARVEADEQGVTVEEILGERAFIIDHVHQSWGVVRTPHQVAQLAEAIQMDIVSRDNWGFDWSNTISFSLVISGPYRTQNWGRTWFQVPWEGYSARWLIDNGFIPEGME